MTKKVVEQWAEVMPMLVLYGLGPDEVVAAVAQSLLLHEAMTPEARVTGYGTDNQAAKIALRRVKRVMETRTLEVV